MSAYELMVVWPAFNRHEQRIRDEQRQEAEMERRRV